MGESFTLSHNASNSVLPQPTPALVAEDDDEPPSSGPRNNRETQITTALNGVPSKSTAVDVTVLEKDYAYDAQIIVEKSASNPKQELAVGDEIVVHGDDFAAGDLEKLNASELNASGDPPPGRHRFKVMKLSPAARIRAMFTPRHPIGPRPTYYQSLMATIRYTPLNFCLVFIPISWAFHFSGQSATLVFIFSGLGIVPLAALLGLGTEQIALKTSQSIGGLLNASLGNLIEMIISGIALRQCELEVVQSALLGGLLSNLLLVLGSAFIVGGFRFNQQQFQPMVAQLNSSLLILAVISLIIPAAFHQYLESRLAPGSEIKIMLQLSRGSAIILILIYIAYLVFQFSTHKHMFLDTIQEYTNSSRSSSPSSLGFSRRSTQTLPVPNTATDAPPSPSSISSSSSSSFSAEIEAPKLNTPSAILLLVTATVFAYISADHLVGSLEGLVSAHPNISKEWITLIVIPIISNAAEHTTAVIVASKGKFDLAMSVAVGSCIQIALFVIPVLILVAWGMGKPLTLLFDPLETVVLFFSVLVVKFSVEDGKSHWMSGLVLIGVYVLIALSFWNFPETVRMIQGQVLECF
ncbi:Sodium/calcium exchanger protein-domain-containing protein [Crassisporium funariophilum]|nr:Sodium/calcium exchanger protein-domain-containing protein [Crassisporium funariophilum]